MSLSKLAKLIVPLDESLALEVLGEMIAAANRSEVEIRGGRDSTRMSLKTSLPGTRLKHYSQLKLSKTACAESFRSQRFTNAKPHALHKKIKHTASHFTKTPAPRALCRCA
jgi:hypothetical protein